MTWVIQVMTGISGREYPSVTDAEILTIQQQLQRLPTWRLVTVPPEYQHLDGASILQACYASRINWRKVEKNERTPNRPGPGPDPRPDQ